MPPAQSTTSPRRLRKAEGRAEKRFKAINANYEAETRRMNRFDFWLNIVEKEQPEWDEEKKQKRALELASMNRAQLRSNGINVLWDRSWQKPRLKVRTRNGGVLVFDFEKFVESLQQVAADASSPELDTT